MSNQSNTQNIKSNLYGKIHSSALSALKLHIYGLFHRTNRSYWAILHKSLENEKVILH